MKARPLLSGATCDRFYSFTTSFCTHFVTSHPTCSLSHSMHAVIYTFRALEAECCTDLHQDIVIFLAFSYEMKRSISIRGNTSLSTIQSIDKSLIDTYTTSLFEKYETIYTKRHRYLNAEKFCARDVCVIFKFKIN